MQQLLHPTPPHPTLTWAMIVYRLSVLVQVHGLLHVIRGLGCRLLLLLYALLHSTCLLYALLLLHSIDTEHSSSRDAAIHHEWGKDRAGVATTQEGVKGRDIAFG